MAESPSVPPNTTGTFAARTGCRALTAHSLPNASGAPPTVSVDKGGTVTFVNQIPAENRGGISIPLVGSVTATVHTDVAVSFFGQNRPLQTGQSTSWTFDDAATPGTVTYTYRIVPQAGLAAPVANQVVNTVTSQLPRLPAPIPYVVQTIAPDLPTLPSVNLPQLPTVEVPLPLPGNGSVPAPGSGPLPTPDGAPVAQPPAAQPQLPAGVSNYSYDTGAGAARLSPSDAGAARAFDPARFVLAGGGESGSGSVARAGAGGAGGAPGGYDGASVPVFGQLAGLDGAALDEESSEQAAGAQSPAGRSLPAAALAAVVALAAVTAALVRTHQASRSPR